MIGGDEVESAVAQGTPERRSVTRLADRWRALEFGCTVRDVFGGERQVVRARFGGDGDAVRLCACHLVGRVGRCDMDDVYSRREFPRKTRDHPNRVDLRFWRTRGEIACVGARADT